MSARSPIERAFDRAVVYHLCARALTGATTSVRDPSFLRTDGCPASEGGWAGG